VFEFDMSNKILLSLDVVQHMILATEFYGALINQRRTIVTLGDLSNS